MSSRIGRQCWLPLLGSDAPSAGVCATEHVSLYLSCLGESGEPFDTNVNRFVWLSEVKKKQNKNKTLQFAL